MAHNPSSISPIAWREDSLVLLDQRYLPGEQRELICQTIDQAAQAIAELVVRGAPAIGITAAYAVCLGIRQAQQDAGFDLQAALQRLAVARPTAVNLRWAVDLQREVLQGSGELAFSACLDNARSIHQRDIDDNLRMGELGANLIQPGSRVLTHCNAGALATGGYGTALGVVRSAWRAGKLDRVFASETRPWQQGLRLTAWELAHDGIDVSVIVEGAASSLFREQNIDWIIVGADRVCANGDVINKVGTCNLALLGREFGVSTMVVAPTSTIDLNTPGGAQVDIEQRDAQEILADNFVDNAHIGAWNPVFDLTPVERVDALVTEKGVVLQPDKRKIQSLFDPE